MTARLPDDSLSSKDSTSKTATSETATSEMADLSAADIEAAYAQALETMNAVEQAVPELAASEPDSDTQADGSSEATVESSAPEQEARRSSPSSGERQQERPDSLNTELPADPIEHVLQPRQVIEAALFVGGMPLTAKRLSTVLGHESNGEAVEDLIARLNEQYIDEERPYEIRLQEGGYQLTLRAKFERVRDRVYGRNPKEVKLSQEALEVLACVAYRQPVRCQEIEAAGKTNAAAVLRQLLRRQLVSLVRSDDASSEVSYATTPRFLELFGLRNLDELPLPEDLALK